MASSRLGFWRLWSLAPEPLERSLSDGESDAADKYDSEVVYELIEVHANMHIWSIINA
jgi:hypothetical protein